MDGVTKYDQYVRRIFILLFVITIILTIPMPVYAVEKTGEEMVADIIKQLDLQDESYYNKVILCANWISENIYYDFYSIANGTEGMITTKDTMTARRGTCEGYANVFKEFMKQIGVPCLYISDGRMNHAYNMVLMNDYQWYLVEPQSTVTAVFERPLYEEYLRDAKERIHLYESLINKPGYDIEEQRYNIAEAEKEIIKWEEALKKLTGKGDLNITQTHRFLGGINDLVENEGYYEFVKLADRMVYGYPVATTGLNSNPDKTQKEFVSKSRVSFTKNDIVINAATMKTNYETDKIEDGFTLELKNYDIFNLSLEFRQLTYYDFNSNESSDNKTNYNHFFSNIRNYFMNGQSLLISGPDKDVFSMSFQLTAKTIYGDESLPLNVTIKFPQLTHEVSESLFNGLKVGNKLKLDFTDDASINDFEIILEKDHLKYIDYNSETGEINAKAETTGLYPHVTLKSKTNESYYLYYPINVLGTSTSSTATTANTGITAIPTSSNVLVDDKEISFDAYLIDGNNYFKLRDVAQVVNGSSKQFEVTWDGIKNAINLVSGKSYTAAGGELAEGDGNIKNASASTSTIYKDGAIVNLTAYSIGGNNYFKLRDLGQTFDFNVSWDAANNAVVIDTNANYITD